MIATIDEDTGRFGTAVGRMCVGSAHTGGRASYQTYKERRRRPRSKSVPRKKPGRRRRKHSTTNPAASLRRPSLFLSSFGMAAAPQDMTPLMSASGSPWTVAWQRQKHLMMMMMMMMTTTLLPLL